MNLGNQKMGKTQRIVIAVLTIFTLVRLSPSPGVISYSTRSLNLTNDDQSLPSERINSYDWSNSVVAVLNTPKTGTGGLFTTFLRSWRCRDAPSTVKGLFLSDCKYGRRAIRTHSFSKGSEEIQRRREEYPEAKCLIVTSLRSPATWFASAYLERAKEHWRPKEDMVRDFRKFLSVDRSTRMMHRVLPDLLREFDGGSLMEQSRIMDRNGGYSLMGPAPSTSILAGCDLVFLRMEDSKRWPEILREIYSDVRYEVGISRLKQHPDATGRINAIAEYELTSEEKMNIYARENSFVRDWFDSYGYMDDVVDKNIGDNAATISSKV